MPVNYYTTSDHLEYLSAVLGSTADEDDLFQFGLPIPPTLDATGRRGWTLEMKEGTHEFGIGDAGGSAFSTSVWGYALPGQAAGYLGPTLLAETDAPIQVNWKNKLPLDSHLLPVDHSLHLAMPDRFPLEDGAIPTVVHLHGGKNRSSSDGLPDQWAIQNNREVGPLWRSPVSTYDNDQEAATLWYHDHALGITRLNVYAGLAGFYLLTDEVEQGLIDPAGAAPATLPGDAFTAPLAIQDKAFTPDGKLYFPARDGDVLPGTTDQVEVPDDPGFMSDASAQPEFFGNIITVNGMAWPSLDVDPGMWRFRLLNGSDSRFYLLDVEDTDPDADPAVYLIGTDGGLLPEAVELTDSFVLEPGGRLDIVVDFSGLDPGTEVTLRNNGPAFEPFKGLDESGNLVGATAADEIDVDDQGDPALVDNIMQFHVSLSNIDGNDADDVQLSHGTELAGDSFEFVDPAQAVETRRLGLFEGTDEFGRVQPLLGVAENTTDINGDPVQYGPQPFGAPVTEDPLLGSTEVWEWYNFTEDAHPIHVHLVQYQVLEKRKIWFEDEDEDGVPDDRNDDGDLDYLTTTPVFNSEGEFEWATVGDNVDVVVVDEVVPLGPEYLGNQDTVWIGPGEMVSAVMEFEKAGPYVWHCHILSHEDHEMMRPFELVEQDALLA